MPRPGSSSNKRYTTWTLDALDKELFHSRYHDNESFENDDDDTVITSNFTKKSISINDKLHRARKNGGKILVTDKRRAPKVAALLFLSFFGFSCSSYILQSIKTSIIYDDSTAAGISFQNGTDGVSSSHNINDWIDEMSRPNIDMNGNPILLPVELSNNLADTNSPRGENHEAAIFWHVPRSAGSTVKHIASHCYGLTLASEVGPYIDPDAATQNQLITVVDAKSGAKFLNVDTTSPEGIERARGFNLASYNDLDLVVTPYVFMASEALFNHANKGRLFIFLRHPIDRAVSMYYYLRDKTGIRGAHIGDTIELYGKSNLVENNWMTRFLTNKLGGEITSDDEALAKEILRTKVLVGLLSKKTESVHRFKVYYGWKVKDENDDCEDKLLQWGWSGKNKHANIIKGSDAWNLLQEQNSFDIRLYEYAVKLFEVQGSTIFGKEY